MKLIKSKGFCLILVALGANLPSPLYGSPRETLEAVTREMERKGIRILSLSPWYRSAPVPASDQPWFVNGIAKVECNCTAARLMELLHELEEAFGRVRSIPNAPRIVDLDLLAYDDFISEEGQWPILPHPRLSERAFVLLPLADIVPNWRHPKSGRTVQEMIDALCGDQMIEKVE